MAKSKTSFGLKRLSARLDYRYIYILGNTRYVFRYKIGIARSVENRVRGIDNSLNGTTYEIFAARFFYAQRIEQFMHGVYRPLNARMEGSGKTEWFWMLIPVSPTLLLTVILAIQWFVIPMGLACLYYFFH